MFQTTRGLAVLTIASLAGCSGVANPPAGTSNAPTDQSPVAAMREAQPDAIARPAWSSPGGSANVDHYLYIGNRGNDSITVYRHDESGNSAPVDVIAGPKTQLSSIGQLSGDAQGNLYVANGASVLVFAHGAHGNVAPIRTIGGAATTIFSIDGLVVDKTTGKIFVATDTPPLGDPVGQPIYLLRFAPNASGNVAPYARATISHSPTQLALDSTGANIIDSHYPSPYQTYDSGFDTYPRQFENGSKPTPIYDVISFSGLNVADDPTTQTYLSIHNENYFKSQNGIYRLHEDSTGCGPACPGPETLAPSPVSIITSDTCGSQLSVAPGPAPYTYVTHAVAAGCSSDAVYVYANDANGDASPVRTLTGPATLLDQPYGIYHEGT